MIETISEDHAAHTCELRLHGRTLLARDMNKGVHLTEMVEGLMGPASRIGTTFGHRLHDLGILPRDAAGPHLSITQLIDLCLGDLAAQRAQALAGAGALFAWTRDLRAGVLLLDSGNYEEDRPGAGRKKSRALPLGGLELGRGLHTILDGKIMRLLALPIDPDSAATAHARVVLVRRVVQGMALVGGDGEAWVNRLLTPPPGADSPRYNRPQRPVPQARMGQRPEVCPNTPHSRPDRPCTGILQD